MDTAGSRFGEAFGVGYPRVLRAFVVTVVAPRGLTLYIQLSGQPLQDCEEERRELGEKVSIHMSAGEVPLQLFLSVWVGGWST